MRKRLALLAVLSLIATGIVARRVYAATTTFTVTVASPLAYVFNGGAPDQALTLTRGETYVFQMSTAVASAHPFFISTTTGVEPPVAFTDPGLTGNGTATVTFTVPLTGTLPPLFYQCSVHSFMTNTITLVAPPPPVPALDGKMVFTLGALLLAVATGALVWQRRKRAGRLLG